MKADLVVSSGMKFGELTTQWSYGSGINKHWKCICSCGNICYVKEGALLKSITKDCGAILHENQSKDKKKTYSNLIVKES